MARIRSVHPGQWTDGDFIECSPLARLLCIALRNQADDHGAFRWKPATIKATCLPADNCDIEALLSELVEAKQIVTYDHEGKRYGIVVDFLQWQRPKKPQYLYPVPPEFSTSTELVKEIQETSSVPVPYQFRTSTEIPPQREEVGDKMKEVERKKEEELSLRSSARDDVSRETSDWPKDYREQFWNAYPRKKAKKSAFKALDRIRKSGEVAFDRLMAAILKIPIGEPVFIPHPATWLNQGRWDDEQLPGETPPRGPGPPVGNVIAAADRLVEKIRAFDEPAPDYHNLPPELDRSLRGGTGAPDVRLLPPG